MNNTQYIGVEELTAAQRTELKQNYFMDSLAQEGAGCSCGDLANIDSLVSDEEINEVFAGTHFVADDFACTAQPVGWVPTFEGPDASLEISLGEYGLAWCPMEAGSHELDVVYGVEVDEECNYTRFARCIVDLAQWAQDLKEKRGQNSFPDLEAVAEMCGEDPDVYSGLYVDTISTRLLQDLISYYGYQNICGECFYEWQFMDLQQALDYVSNN